MKNLLVIVTMLVFASVSFAQSVASASQTGDNNKSTVSQSGTNGAEVTQIGNLNQSTVNQTGINGLKAGQTGDNNRATVTQQNSATDISDANFAEFEQGGGIYNGTNTGDANKLTINQDGLRNYAKSREYYSNNVVDIDQVGNDNTAKQWIWAAGAGNTAIQSQTGGNNNYSEIAANGLDGANYAKSTQHGSDNWNAIGQGWSGYSHGSNTAILEQVGNNNKVTLAADLALPGYTVDLHGMGVHQYGVGNSANIAQTGDNNEAGLYQFDNTDLSGDYNTFNLTQAGNGNKVLAVQLGDGNSAKLDQSGAAEADILQEGNNNTLRGVGSATASSLNGSILDLDQLGSDNTLYLKQTNGSTANVYQNGIGNTATVNQK